MLHIKMPFGYNSICLDRTFVLHTGKIRIKADYASITKSLNHCTQLQYKVSGNNSQYTTVSFATTCKITNDDLIGEINKFLCDMMHERIDAKYAPRNFEPEMVAYEVYNGELIAL
jgi:hypothetical protein